jgi:hypothetical protein
MTAKYSLQEREKELRPLLATSAGRKELQKLASRYHAASGKLRPAGIRHHLHLGPREATRAD